MMNNNFMSMLQSLQSNPMQFLMQRRFNIPQNVQSDPNAIVQHLLNTGQVSQEQYNQAVRMAMQFKR